MRGGRAQMTDGDPDREHSIESRVRQKDFSTRIYRIEQPFVEEVEFRRAEVERARICAETDNRELNWREALEIGMLINSPGKFVGKPDVLPQDAPQPCRAKM